MNKPKVPKKILDKRIPTLIGLVVLVVALVAGSLLIGTGGGVFAPRATPSTTPQLIRVSNVTDTSFSVSFLTDELIAGFVKYGEEEKSLKSQAGDDRDQLSGTVGSFHSHHITIRGLSPNQTYYYTIGTGSGATFDNGGSPFKIQTATRNGSPAAAKTIYGNVLDENGSPAEGAIVYVTIAGAGDMSNQVKKTGSWAIPLSNARKKDGSGYASVTDIDTLLISVQGTSPTQKASVTTLVKEAQPVAEIKFGGNSQVAQPPVATSPVPSLLPETSEETTPQQVSSLPPLDIEKKVSDKTATASARDEFINDLLKDTDVLNEATASPQITTIDLSIEATQEATTATPKIIGKVIPNVVVSISVHSETAITQEVTSDEDGNFELDIADLSEGLEPGEHTVTYSYTDPDTGEVIEKTVDFTVAEAQLADASEPYSSGNPYPIATESSEASISATATESAKVAIPSTQEAIPVSGSVGTTLALVFGGLFFITAGLWSLWISNQLENGDIEI